MFVCSIWCVFIIMVDGNRRWHLQALTDPLTLLPNFRALEQAPEQEAGKSFAACALIILSL
ncbi:hypothetical protein DMH88_08700 [Escherichia coli]|nr:hypothetical protein [Escherichia coli]